MDIAMIGAAYNGLKFAKDALKLSLDLKIESESREHVHAALEKLGAVQDSLFELREELFKLQSENEQLRRELKTQQDWESLKTEYKLQTTSGGAVVYQFIGEPQHFACPSCFSKSTVQILQDQRLMAGTFECPGCKTKFPINAARHNHMSVAIRRRSEF